ncbi:glycosyltransferase [Micromonospora sp. DT44]|uniref:glycosyltransferase n=1 Tax=Micromonospora sp. DT44 TaxID=3393439 RepID=UPI003CE9B289
MPPELSAATVLSRGQRNTLLALLLGLTALVAAKPLVGYGLSPITLVHAVIVTSAVTYVVYESYQMMLAIVGFRRISPPATKQLTDKELPTYSVLVPLYKEAAVLPTLIPALAALDYPVEKLQILLVIEESDDVTRAALDGITLGQAFEVVLINPSMPRTKPKACNIALERVWGELCTVYDAEDRPDPQQLRVAATAFRAHPDEVVCLQAELSHWNPYTNWLTATFAAEYALRYGPTMRGLDRLQVPIPLGGNSNHFRTAALCELGAWDPYNLTEDADLGMRIARRGWVTHSIPSLTLEEANSDVGNWIRQRSRWIKGHVQTWLVHMRQPRRLWKELGPKGFLGFQMVMGLPALGKILHPFIIAVTIASFLPGSGRSEAIFPPFIASLGLITLIIATIMVITQLVSACVMWKLYRCIPTAFTWHLYGMLMSVAAVKGIGQLMRPSRRFHWELTKHGLVNEPGGPPATPLP